MIVAEFEESGSRYLQSLRTRETSGMSLLQAEMQLKQQEENLLDLGKQAYDEEQNRRLELKNAIEQLQAQLSSWAQNYLFSSPICSKITFMTVWSRNQNVQSGETVLWFSLPKIRKWLVKPNSLYKVREKCRWDRKCISVWIITPIRNLVM